MILSSNYCTLIVMNHYHAETLQDDISEKEQDDNILPLLWYGIEPRENLKEYVSDMMKIKALSKEVEFLNSEIVQLEEVLRNQKPKTIENNPHYLNFRNRTISFEPIEYQKCIECLLMKGKYPEIYNTNGCICTHHMIQTEAGTSEKGGNCICNTNVVSVLRYARLIYYKYT